MDQKVSGYPQKYRYPKVPTRTPWHTLVAPPQDVRAPQDQAQDSAGAAPKGDESVGANSWRRSRRRNTGTAAAGSGRVRKHLWLKEQTMQRCPRSSSLLARMRCLRARPRMRISSGSSHVNLALTAGARCQRGACRTSSSSAWRRGRLVAAAQRRRERSQRRFRVETCESQESLAYYSWNILYSTLQCPL